MEGDVLMPRWSRRHGASADLVARWERYEAALLVHEEGHLETGRDLAKALKVELPKLPPAANCKALDEAIRARYKALLEAARQRDTDYDKRTGHGATQGARFR
jgi:predicted secreted Zn-dependent protease